MTDNDAPFPYTAEQLVDPGKITLTSGNIVKELGVSGYINKYPDYHFEAKVFDIGSKYGIDYGRVSKLRVFFGEDRENEILNYQRGWTVGEGPDSHNTEQKNVLKEILEGFPEVESAKP